MDEATSKRQFDVLAELPGIITAVTAIAVMLSLSKQIGFFSVLDSKLISLLSIQDIIQNSLVNLPGALFAILVARVVRVVRPQGPMVPGPKLQGLLTFLYRPFYRGEVIFLIVLGTIFILIDPYWATTIQFLLVASVWTSLLGWVDTQPHLSEIPYFDEMLAAFFFALLWYLSGVGEAQHLSKQPNYVVHRDGKDIPLDLARTSSDFFIGLDATGKVLAIPRDGATLTKIDPKKEVALIPLEGPFNFVKGFFIGKPIGERWPDGRP